MKINLNGIITDATIVDVIASDERWNEYQLADGAVMRVKIVLIRVLRADSMRNSNGEPIYQTQTQIVIDTRSPEKKG